MRRVIRVGRPTISLDDPRIRKLGKHFSREAYELAVELVSRGADLVRLKHPYLYRDDLPDDGEVRIPAQFADILMAILLSLPRSKPGPRPKESTQKAQRLVAAGSSKRSAAREVAREAGDLSENLRRRLRGKPRPRKPRK